MRNKIIVILSIFAVSWSQFLTPLNAAPTRAEAINVFVDPDFPLPVGDSLLSFYRKKQYTFMYKEIIPIASVNHTYFEILGSNGDGYPDFYGGIQQLYDGSKAAIFSAWDVNAPCCANSQPGSAPVEDQVSVIAKGDRTVTRQFGGEGTGMNSMINNFSWNLNEKVAMLAEIEPAGKNSIISAAIKVGNGPWEFMTSFLIPEKIDAGMPGGVSFIEDYGPGSESPQYRAMHVGPTIVADEYGNKTVFTNYYAMASSPSKGHRIQNVGDKLFVETGLSAQTGAKPDYRFQLLAPSIIPDFSDAIKLIESKTSGFSTKYQERLAREKAAAELAAIKAAEEAKAKEIAEANALAEAKAKAELEAKAKADEAAKLKLVSKKKSITCIKGNITKKIIGTNPKCPAGYKKK